MRIVFWGNQSGSRNWRLMDPAKYMAKKGFDCIVTNEGISKKWAEWADVYVLQGCTDKDGIALLYEYQQTKGKKIVLEIDDFLHLNKDNPHAVEHEKWDAEFTISQTAKIADMITVTTEELASKWRGFNKNVKVLPNCMDMEQWNLPIYRNESESIRIGWAGSVTHVEDLKTVVAPIKKLCKEFPNIELIFCGDPRVGKLFDGCNVENQMGQPAVVWPTRLHSFRLDIGIAPLRDTEFNKCKSNIKWMEYGVCKVPCVASNILYSLTIKDGVNGFIAKDEDEWYLKLKNLILSKNLRVKIGEAAYRKVMSEFDLEKNIDKWVSAYNSLFG